MEPVKIAIASVLKPLKDSRSYYKFALSLRETNKYQINIIGFCVKKESDENLIKFHPLFYQNRKSFARLAAGFRLLKLIQKIKPAILITTTYEQLPAAVIGKLFFKYKIIYDVQENYALNLTHNNPGNKLKNRILAKVIQCLEFCSRPFITHHIFAEKCYQEEFPSINNYTVLENKYQGPLSPKASSVKLDKKHLQFLLCGTLAEVYGSLDAIQWFMQFQKQFPDSKMRILGHTAIPSLKYQLETLLSGVHSIQVNVASKPIPYEVILEAYKEADVVLLAYHQIPSISPKIPSKLFECLALRKPFLYTANQKWKELAEEHQAGMEVDFNNFHFIPDVYQKLKKETFYSNADTSNAYWKADENRFLDLIQSLAKS